MEQEGDSRATDFTETNSPDGRNVKMECDLLGENGHILLQPPSNNETRFRDSQLGSIAFEQPIPPPIPNCPSGIHVYSNKEIFTQMQHQLHCASSGHCILQATEHQSVALEDVPPSPPITNNCQDQSFSDVSLQRESAKDYQQQVRQPLVPNDQLSDCSVALVEQHERAKPRHLERERRRAIRQQTMVTKLLKHWRLPEDHRGGAWQLEEAGMTPEQRLASLRRRNEIDFSAIGRDLSNASNCDVKVLIDPRTTAVSNSNPEQSQVKSRQTTVSSLPRSQEDKIRHLCEKRIDDCKRHCHFQTQTGNKETKTWKSTEVFTASLLSTRGSPITASPRLPISAIHKVPSPVPIQHLDEFECPSTSCSFKPQSISHIPTWADRSEFLMESRPGMVGISTKRGPLESGEGRAWKEKSKFEHDSKSTVVRESIADAHRTREMWQQIAASCSDARPLDERTKSWTSDRVKQSTPSKTTSSSLQRKAPSESTALQYTWSNGGSSRGPWAPKAGLSTQMERQIKEHRSNRVSALVRSAVEALENDPSINAMEDGQWARGPYDDYSAPLEIEKLLFINYMKSHPEVVQSLGITVPLQVITSGHPVGMKVELKVIETDVTPPSTPIDRVSKISPAGSPTYRNSFGAPVDNSVIQKQWRPGGHFTLPRYEKQNKGPSKSTPLTRRQSDGDRVDTNTPTCNTTPRKWKLAKWEPPPPPCNMANLTDGYVAENGIVYRSAGECLIAKEIREYKAREEELRRSRSELGLSNISDLADHCDKSKERNSHSQVCAMDTTVDAATGNSPAANGAPVCTADALEHCNPNKSSPKPVSHVIGGGGHTVAAYPPDLKKSEVDVSNGLLSNIDEGDFMPVEARIEREMEDLRRREVELKRQREAMGMHYQPVGLAQFGCSLPDKQLQSTHIRTIVQDCVNIRKAAAMTKSYPGEESNPGSLAVKRRSTVAVPGCGPEKNGNSDGKNGQSPFGAGGDISSRHSVDVLLQHSANVRMTEPLSRQHDVKSSVVGNSGHVTGRENGPVATNGVNHANGDFANGNLNCTNGKTAVEDYNEKVIIDKFRQKESFNDHRFSHIDDILVSL